MKELAVTVVASFVIVTTAHATHLSNPPGLFGLVTGIVVSAAVAVGRTIGRGEKS